MRATSEQQAEALRRGAVPASEEVRPGIHALALEMPGMQPPYSYVYALIPGRESGRAAVGGSDGGSREVHLIDAALASEENWEALGRELALLDRGIADIASVTVTHLHGDHTGLAWRIREASGAVVRMHEREVHDIAERSGFGASTAKRAESGAESSAEDGGARAAVEARLEAWGVPTEARETLLAYSGTRSELIPSGTVDETVHDGDAIDFGAWQGRAIHTPGHTNGHLCIAIDSERLLFSGDHLMPVTSSGLALGGRRSADPLGEYLASLDRLAEYEDFEVLPGHDFRFRGVVDRSSDIRRHHDARTEQIAGLLAAARERGEEPTTWEIASGVGWTGGWENLAGVSLLSALGQTEMHLDRVRAAGR